MRQIKDDVGSAALSDLYDLPEVIRTKIIVSVEGRRRCQKAQMIRALCQKSIQVGVVYSIRGKDSLGNSLSRILIEIDIRRAKSKIKVRQNDIAAETA